MGTVTLIYRGPELPGDPEDQMLRKLTLPLDGMNPEERFKKAQKELKLWPGWEIAR